jgi:hypothetical protein
LARRITFFVILTAILAGLIIQEREHRHEAARMQQWKRKQKNLPPSGGKNFERRVVIDVPVFRQSDPLWANDSLGPSTIDTLGSAGCAVASCAMVLASYGIDTDPQRLNDFLKGNNGFTPEAWLKWEVAARCAPTAVKFCYEDDPSFQLIDENLARGNPVIIRLRYPGGITHFVVVCGKDGYDYLIVDPGSRSNRGVYPLKDFGSNIEALRFYEPVKSG